MADLQNLRLINQLDIGSQVIRALDMKGNVPNSSDSTYEIAITAEDLTQPEFDYLRHRNRFMGSPGVVAAVAAQFGMAVWGFNSNQAARNTLGVLDGVTIENSGAAAMSFSYGLATLDPLLNPLTPPFAADDRVIGAAGTPLQGSVMKVGGGTLAASPLAAAAPRYLLAATSSIFLPIRCVQTFKVPSAGILAFYVVGNTVNQAMTATFWWRERMLLQSEF